MSDPNDAYAEPLNAMAFEGAVLVEGGRRRPVAIALTPQAALETAERLRRAAMTAISDGTGACEPGMQAD